VFTPMIQASEPDPNVVDFGRNRAGRELLTKEIGSAIFHASGSKKSAVLSRQ
jgi:hypothetical protein